MMSIPESTRQFREHYQNTEISKYYSGIGHFTFTSVLCICIIAWSIWQLQSPSWLELLTVPITFLYANLSEYLGHRGPMHHKRKFLGLVFKRHTLQHHRYFTDEAMECASSRDFKMILFPPVLIIFFFTVFALPVGAVLYALLSHNVGYLFVATAIGYFLNYEWLHLLYHQPESSVFFKLPGLKALRRHHLIHHEPALMASANFNITYPICDTLFGTRAVRTSQPETAKTT